MQKLVLLSRLILFKDKKICFQPFKDIGLLTQHLNHPRCQFSAKFAKIFLYRVQKTLTKHGCQKRKFHWKLTSLNQGQDFQVQAIGLLTS